MYIYTAMVEELKNTLEGYLPVGLYIDYQTFIKKLKANVTIEGDRLVCRHRMGWRAWVYNSLDQTVSKFVMTFLRFLRL